MCDYRYCFFFFFWNQITGAPVWHVINFLPNLCWQRQASAVLASVCPSVPTDAQPSPSPPPPGPFCWWRGWLISAYLAPTPRSDTGTIGNIWPGDDAESGEMEARQEKESSGEEEGRGACHQRGETWRSGVPCWTKLLANMKSFFPFRRRLSFGTRSVTYLYTRIKCTTSVIVFWRKADQLNTQTIFSIRGVKIDNRVRD